MTKFDWAYMPMDLTLHTPTIYDGGAGTSGVEFNTNTTGSADLSTEMKTYYSDYLIDLGPDGGRGGGRILSCGTPDQVAKSSEGYTPQFLREILTAHK